jgi:hypothetical protein
MQLNTNCACDKRAYLHGHLVLEHAEVMRHCIFDSKLGGFTLIIILTMTEFKMPEKPAVYYQAILNSNLRNHQALAPNERATARALCRWLRLDVNFSMISEMAEAALRQAQKATSPKSAL